MEEKLKMRLEVRKGETLGKLNRCFREKIQLEEQLKENEVLIHFQRGQMEAYTEIQILIDEMVRGEQLEAMRGQDE